MTLCKAVSERINALLAENKIGITQFSRQSGIPFETLRSIYKSKSTGINLKTVLLIARGFNITGAEFLDDPIFESEDLYLE